ncbi:MAG: dihydrolipoyl dehydrogenase [Phycisphaeraceae bacterium]|nr:dihydrolipoyl dehydrogenase [Phycisphaeraceae bacterium]
MHTQLLVLGGGPGGYAAAFLAADLGMEVTLVDQDPNLGGVCLQRGCIPSKALLHASRLITEARDMADWGIHYDAPRIDVHALRARKDKVIGTLTMGLKTLARKRNVKVIQARGFFEDSQRMRLDSVDGSKLEHNCITYDHAIIAAGSRPAMPALFNLPTDRVMDSTGALALQDIPARLLVVGGGYIGLEMASVYAAIGSHVTVVEMMPKLLPAADPDLVKPLRARMEKLLDEILLGTKVAKVEDKGSTILVTLEDAAGKQSQREFDRVLVAIGRRPNTDGLGLENTKVKLSPKGFIEVDDKQRTADPAICAIGDIAGEPMLAHKATKEGKVAVEALLGHPAAFDNQAIPAVVFTDPEIAWAGLTEQEAKDGNIPYKTALYPWAASGRAQAVGRPDGLTKLVIDPETDRILGVGLVGVSAGELIAEGVLAIEMGCSVRDLTETIHPHPTMSETVPNAGEVHFGVATELYKPRRDRRVEE